MSCTPEWASLSVGWVDFQVEEEKLFASLHCNINVKVSSGQPTLSKYWKNSSASKTRKLNPSIKFRELVKRVWELEATECLFHQIYICELDSNCLLLISWICAKPVRQIVNFQVWYSICDSLDSVKIHTLTISIFPISQNYPRAELQRLAATV